MQIYKISFISVLIVVLACNTTIEAKKEKKHSKSSGKSHKNKSKTSTKWSSTTEGGSDGRQLGAEEHGYFVKRKFLPSNAGATNLAAASAPQSPPYLAIPIAWYPCEGDACTKANTAAISGSAATLLDGFLCDDDCTEPYEPICGKTVSELAVFYTECKLHVAKCRTHGLWSDVPYQECKKTHPHEIAYAERKFKASPFFRDSSEQDKIGHQIAEAVAEAIVEEAVATAVKNEVNAALVKPVQVQSVSASNPNEGSVVIVEKPVKETEPVSKPIKAATDAQSVNTNKPEGGIAFAVQTPVKAAEPVSKHVKDTTVAQGVRASNPEGGIVFAMQTPVKATEPVSKPTKAASDGGIVSAVQTPVKEAEPVSKPIKLATYGGPVFAMQTPVKEAEPVFDQPERGDLR